MSLWSVTNNFLLVSQESPNQTISVSESTNREREIGEKGFKDSLVPADVYDLFALLQISFGRDEVEEQTTDNKTIPSTSICGVDMSPKATMAFTLQSD